MSQQRTEWLINRQKGLGGSDAAPALGMSKWKTQYELYLDKIMPVQDEGETKEMRWGRLLEPAILQAYQEETGYQVESPGFDIREHADHPWMRCTPDGLATLSDGEIRNVQVKTAFSDDGWGDAFSDDIPLEYSLQVQHEMAVLGVAATDVPVLIGGSDFRIYTVWRNPELQKVLIEEEREFWNRVLNREPPEPTSLEDAKLRWQEANEDYLNVDPIVLDEWRGLHIAKEKIKEWEDRADYHKLQLQKVCQDNQGLTYEGKKICSWKNQERRAVNQKKLEAEYPEVFEACRETSVIRVFRTNKVKGLLP